VSFGLICQGSVEVDMGTDPLLLTVEEAAPLFRRSRSSLYAAIQRGEVTAGVVRIGSKILISRPALLRWLESAGLPPPQQAAHGPLSPSRTGPQ
jgi:excisionase family DNA binding protein